METREIHIGEETFRITRFKGLKAVMAGALLSRVMREVPELQERVSAFRKKFKENNAIVVTPAMAKTPRYAGLGFGPEDFEAAGGNIELPEEPTSTAIVINVFPDVFDLARKEVQRFFGLLVIPNRELEQADDDDEVEEALDKHGKRVIRSGDLDELLELVLVGAEVLQEQMASKRERLGKIPLPWLQRLLNPPEMESPENLEDDVPLPETPDMESNGLGETMPIQNETNPSESSNSQPPSSTDSQPASDGIDEPLSTVSPGMS